MPVKMEDVEHLLGPSIDFDPNTGPVREQVQKVSNPELEDRLANIEKTLKEPRPQPQPSNDNSLLLQQLMADPDVVALIRMKNQGKKVQLVDPGEQKPEDIKPPEDVTDPRKMLDYLDRKVESSLRNIVKQELTGLNQKVETVIGNVNEQKVNAYRGEIDQAKKKYKDFENYTPQMKQLAQQVGDGVLTVEELYRTVKARIGESVEQGGSLESEKPTTDTTRVRSNNPPIAPGTRGLRDALSSAFDRVGKK